VCSTYVSKCTLSHQQLTHSKSLRTPLPSAKALDFMSAHKIFSSVSPHDVSQMYIYGLGKLPVPRGVHEFESLRELHVSGFLLCLGGLLVVQCFTEEERAMWTIAKYWRAYRLKTAFRRNEVALKCVAEYFGHPRFQDFSVEVQ